MGSIEKLPHKTNDMLTLNAKNLTLEQVHRLLGFCKLPSSTFSFSSLLDLDQITQLEQEELTRIRDDFEQYLTRGKVSEGLVKALTTLPLMRLAGFYHYPISLSLEEGIEQIKIEDEDTEIAGRLDILAVNHAIPLDSDRNQDRTFFWVLLVESKNSRADALTGLSQLLTYAYKSLESQAFIWGLTTNGLSYRFVYMQRGTPPTYHVMPELNLIDSDRALQLLQIFKAICKSVEV
jgi:transcriptional antiterminator Rof (Rho-off)